MKKYSVQEVFDLLGKEALCVQEVRHGNRASIEVEGYQVHQKSLRYATFYQKGLKCACCGKEGSYFLLEPDRTGAAAATRRHFNLYAEDGTLMTKDHIRPKKWGGQDVVDNLQTMCEPCNRNKGCQFNEEVDCIVGTRITNGEEIVCFNIEDAIYQACILTGAMSKNKKPGKLTKQVIHIALRMRDVIDTDQTYAGCYWKTCKRKMEGVSYEGPSSR